MIDVAMIPNGWWLDGLREIRTRQTYAGDKHEPTGKFICDLQHVLGGRLIEGTGTTADEAFSTAVHNVKVYMQTGPLI